MWRNAKSSVGFIALLVIVLSPAQSSAANVVISQIYGGGGNSGALLKLDFVELVNRGGTATSIDGWSLQYASASASTWQVTNLSGTLPPGAYYLVQLSGGTGGSVDLPPPDAIGATNISASSGKVALASTTAALQGDCPAEVEMEDLVGYGTANCFEGSGGAPAGSNTMAVVRAEEGCTDSNDNAADFSADTPSPRNSSTTADCGIPGSATDTPTVVVLETPTPTVPASASPTPTVTISPTTSPSVTAPASPSQSATPSPTPSAMASPSGGETPTETPAVTETASGTASPSASTTSTPTASPSASTTSTPTASPTSSPSPEMSPSGPNCGNGSVEPGEQCDDGNDIDGDLCPNGCSYRDSGALAHGNHRRRLIRGDGCQLEWYVVDSELTLDSFGFASQTQTCVDQDPGCDFAPEPGRCRILAVVCLNNIDPNLPDCIPDGIERAVVVHPPETRATVAVRGANRAALEYAINHLIDPSNPSAGPVNGLPLMASQTDFCSAPFALDIDRRGAGNGAVNMIVDSFAGDLEPHRERARLRLVCAP